MARNAVIVDEKNKSALQKESEKRHQIETQVSWDYVGLQKQEAG